MKIYFKETSFRDYSRVGYDTVSFSYSVTPYGTEEGHDATSVWYFVELDDTYTQAEASRMAGEAIRMATQNEISIKAAVFELTQKKRRRKNI